MSKIKERIGIMKQKKIIKLSIICACLVCFFTVNNISFAKTNDTMSDKQILSLKQKELSKLNKRK